ncbi:MAG: hypothetical protein LBH60_07495 [Prevotellaceae bacterium]|nr:hypothetical protein [Prevotellaceae bacterium]
MWRIAGQARNDGGGRRNDGEGQARNDRITMCGGLRGKPAMTERVVAMTARNDG